MRIQKLFVAGFVLLLLLFLYGCGGSTGGTGGTTPTPVNKMELLTHTTVPALQIEADIPPMQVNQQVYVAVSIYPTGATMTVGDVQKAENATPVVTQATPVGTPGSTLVNAFGPNQSVFATATLETSSTIFSMSPTGPQTKPLDQYRVEWDWFVTPLVAGKQVIGVDIEAQWTSNLTGKQSASYTLGYPKFPLNVQALPVETTPSPTPSSSPLPSPIPSPTLIPSPPPQPTDNSGAIVTILAAIITTLGTFIVGFITLYFSSERFHQWVNTRFGRTRHL